MKILYLHQYFNVPKGPGGTRSFEFAKKLIERGHQVTMICASNQLGNTGLFGSFEKGYRMGDVDGIEVIEYNLNYSNYDSIFIRSFKFIRYSIASIKLIFTINYDTIFATSTPLTVAIPGIAGKIFRRKRFIFEVRDLWPELPKAMKVITNPIIITLLSILEYLAYSLADKCIGLAPGIVDGIRKRSHNKKKEISFIPNGSDLELFEDRKSMFAHSEICDRDFVAVFSGAHGRANGLDVVLDVATILKEREVNNIKLLFVGDGKLKPHLLQRKSNEGLNNCIFIDPVPKIDMPSLFNRANLGLMVLDNIPSFYNGTSPNKFFDYLAAGLPVLNNYPGWLAEYLIEFKCGYSIEVDNVELFADTLIQAQIDNQNGILLSYSKNARKLAEEKFDREKLADKFIRVIESVI